MYRLDGLFGTSAIERELFLRCDPDSVSVSHFGHLVQFTFLFAHHIRQMLQ